MSPLYSLGLTALLFIFWLILVFWYFWRKYSPLFKLPNTVWIDRQLIKRALFGDGKENVPFKRYIFQRVTDFCQKHEKEGMCVFWYAGPALFVYGEEATKFFSNEPSLIDKPVEYKTFDFMIKDGLFTSSGTIWKKQRKLMNPAFYTRTLRGIVPVVNEHATQMVKQVAQLNGEVTDKTAEILQNITLKIFFESTLGVKSDAPENEYRATRLIKIMPKLLEFVSYRVSNPLLYLDFTMKYSSVGRRHLALNEELKSIIDQIVNELKESVVSRYNNNSLKNHAADSDGTNVLRLKTIGEILIEEHLEDPTFTIEQIRVQLITIITAGFDTASNTVTWILWLLGLHPEVQEQALEEVKAVTCDGEVKYEDTHKMKYLECVIKESLRLFPVGPLFGRNASKDIKFGEYIIPKNTKIGLMPWTLHRNPKIYPNPETFYPERFMDGSSKIKPWTHIPFAEGVRSCIGKNYAMIEMKILLSHLLKNFRIVSPGRLEDAAPVWEIMLRNQTPLRMQFIPR